MVSWILGTLLGAAILTAAGGIGAGEKKEGSGALGTAPGKEPSANADRPVGSEVDFRKLVGQWKRTDRDFRIVRARKAVSPCRKVGRDQRFRDLRGSCRDLM